MYNCRTTASLIVYIYMTLRLLCRKLACNGLIPSLVKKQMSEIIVDSLLENMYLE